MRFDRFQPRITVRRLMIAVAIAAVGLFADRAMRNRADYLQRASFHGSRVSILEVMRDRGEGLFARLANPDLDVVEREQFVRHYAASYGYHEALRQKYEVAARRPWLRVEPDPPEPDGPRRGRGRSLGPGPIEGASGAEPPVGTVDQGPKEASGPVSEAGRR